jgi:sphingomyelin phosphodiesterase acid-like 3
MKVNLAAHNFHAGLVRFILLSYLLSLTSAFAQHAATKQDSTTIPAILLSDIHFEPFWDPAKAPQLAAAPISQWNTILAAAPTPYREQRFQSLQQTCHSRGADTSFMLFNASLQGMQNHAAGAAFVTVSGDLLSHNFSCKFETLFPHAAPGDYRSFVEKTIDYITGELDHTFHGVPVYIALGNNDSDCGDYQLDAHSEFLAHTASTVTREFSSPDQQRAADTFAIGGYYSVMLPTPFTHARLLVLNDIFMSSHYSTCSGKADSTAADAQLAWLTSQLTQARANNEKIWVMGHIPPGVDLHATVSKFVDVCSGQQPIMFLSSEKMADTLTDNSDVIQLALFAHTHMDESKLLKAETTTKDLRPSKSVALKLVPSISPINGNRPSFTVVQIDPSSAALIDYRVYTASNSTGDHVTWNEEYDYARSYHEPAFSPVALSKLIAGFAADPTAKSEASQSYIRNFVAGGQMPILGVVWPQYVCTLSNHTASAFRACACSAAKAGIK